MNHRQIEHLEARFDRRPVRKVRTRREIRNGRRHEMGR